MDISIIIPVFNEEKTLIELLKRVNEQHSENFPLEIIVIDDGSTDNSRKLLESNEILYSKLVKLEKNIGKGGAAREGLKVANGDYVLFQDADLEYNPDDFKKIFHVIENFNAEVVIGSRILSPEYTRVYNYFHKVGNHFITWVFNFVYNTTFTDIYSCYLCIKKQLIDPNKIKSNGWEQQAEILAESIKKSKIYYEVPISYSGRTFEEGKKIRGRHIFKVLYMIVKKRII